MLDVKISLYQLPVDFLIEGKLFAPDRLVTKGN